ncbi:MAG: hypothetical protein JW929_05915 [Anaerolineales bacterium]|nr:hypothetical protein [Anaerolineales bacterium]
MKSHKSQFLPFLAVAFGFAAPALACSVYLGGPDAPGPEITPEGDKSAIEQAWSQAIALAVDGGATVVFTESQMTAYLQQKLDANPGNTFHNAQVFLRDGRIKVYGMLSSGGVSASAILILRPDVTDAGKIDLVLEQAQVGPLDLPAGLLTAVSNVLTEVFTGSVGSLATGFQVKEILVGDGYIAVSGIIR